MTTYLNVEMAVTEEMMKIAIEVKPEAVSLVPENPGEITTEGGLNVRANIAIVRAAVSKLREAGIMASLFIDPDPVQIEAAREVNAQQVELCTAAYAEATLGSGGIHGEGAARAHHELRRLREGAALAAQYGLHVAAGHGLTVRNAGPWPAFLKLRNSTSAIASWRKPCSLDWKTRCWRCARPLRDEVSTIRVSGWVQTNVIQRSALSHLLAQQVPTDMQMV